MLGDPAVRADLVRNHIFGELSRLNEERQKALRASGAEIPGLPNLSKLLMADALRHNRDLSARIMGARAALHAYDSVVGPASRMLPAERWHRR